MTKFLSLVKLLFIQQYRIKPSGDKKKRGGTIVMYVVLAICLLPMIIGLTIATYFLGKFAGKDIGVGALLILVSQGLVLLFGTISVITNVFNGKDADKLLFLPVRSTTIFLAKMSVVYLNEVITTAALVLFALIPFGIGAGMTAGYYLMLPFTLLLVPILPLFVSCVLAMPVSALIAKLRGKGLVRTVFQIILLLGVMVLYILLYRQLFAASGTEDSAATGIEALIEQLIGRLREAGGKMVYVHPDMMLSTAMMASAFPTWILAFAITFAENGALLVAVTLMSMPFYRWILSSSLETSGNKKKKKVSGEQLQVKNKGVLKELISTDIKRVARSGQMGFQAFGSLVASPLIVVLMYFAFNQPMDGGGRLLDALKDNFIYQTVAPLVIVAYMSMLGLSSNVLGLYPISRENKSLYILKSLPISFEKLLLAKVILATVVMLIGDFLTCLLVVILFGIKWYYGICMMLVMAATCFGGMSITTLMDLKSPKLGWTNFNQGLKNAKNSWMALLIGSLNSLCLVVLAVGFVIWSLFAKSVTETFIAIAMMWAVVMGAAIGYAAVCYKIMTRNAANNFAKIEP